MAESAELRKQIFLKALDLPVDERARFLDRLCGDDPALRRQVDALLQAVSVADSFLEKPAAELAGTLDASSPPLPDAVGGNPTSAAEPVNLSLARQIGPYKLLEAIGEGGMGVV